ncbi:hypothetical protein [Actinotalea sp. K2]|uniref:hypothetical protein n=1 Tax=Actinotalea sp. K2 TaxID=2939438 RepID=UPI002016F5FE|nr:hypothetical protein [Actinotalea sp. K2]MCL3860876.1 hypothetical protein [Actinotalea sp. K2]
MPTRLLLDGEDLRSLMLRVRQEMGPDARIVKAERIRTGGFAGFFAKESYELTVEVPDARPAVRARRRPAAAPSGPAAVGIDALLAAAEAAEADGDDLAGAPAPVDVGEVPVVAVAPSGPPAAPEPAGPTVSTSGDSFAEVLESMRAMVGPPGPAVEVPDPAAPPTPDPAPQDGTGDAAPDPAEPGYPYPEQDADHPRSSAAALLELGIPTRLLTGFADPHAAVPLSQLVRRFERPPTVRLEPGTVLAVVGDAHAALRTATQMAHRAGLDPRDIVLAGDIDAVAGHGRRLQTTSAVARYRSKLSPEALYIVVVGVSPARDSWAEGALFLEALAPDQAWAAVDARRKAIDLRRWMRVVGAHRPFDAIAASSTFDAQAPGTVLNLGVPVGWVDGLPATPVVWAAVLSERLADDARWD